MGQGFSFEANFIAFSIPKSLSSSSIGFPGVYFGKERILLQFLAIKKPKTLKYAFAFYLVHCFLGLTTLFSIKMSTKNK